MAIKFNEFKKMSAPRSLTATEAEYELKFEKIDIPVDDEGNCEVAYIHFEGNYRPIRLTLFEENNYDLDDLIGQLRVPDESYDPEIINACAGKTVYVATVKNDKGYINPKFRKAQTVQANAEQADLPF